MPIAEGTAAVIGAGLAAAGTAGTNWLQAQMNKRAFRRNKQLLQMQNDFSLDMWNRTNEYNDPLHQVERLKNAGLNPLYYGLDGSSADSFESAAAAPYNPATMVNPFEGMQNFGMQLAQIENLQANTAKTNNENLTETKRREQLEVETMHINEDIKNLIETRSLTAANRKLAEQALDWNERLNQANLDYTQSSSKLNDSQRKRIEQLLEGEKVIQSKSIEEFAHRWDAWSAAAAKDRALAGLTLKDIENYALIHMDSGFMGTGFSLRNLLIGVVQALVNMPSKGKSSEPELMEGSSPVSDFVSNGGSR